MPVVMDDQVAALRALCPVTSISARRESLTWAALLRWHEAEGGLVIEVGPVVLACLLCRLFWPAG